MFRKLKSLGGGGKGRQKFRLDVTVSDLEGLPEEVGQCRVVWARQAKVSVTKTVVAKGGRAAFNEELSQIATLTKDARGGFDSKEYHFKLQAPERGNQAKYVTLGKAALDMARFTGDTPSRPQSIKLKLALPQHRTAVLSVLVASVPVKGMGDDDEDDMSVVTGVSGLSGIEQDLSGFDGDSRRASAAGGTGLGTPLQRVTEEAENGNGALAGSPRVAATRSTEGEERSSTVRKLEAELAAARDELAVAKAKPNGALANGVAAGAPAAELAEENERLKKELDEARERAAAAPPAAEASAAAAEVAAVTRRLESLQLENKQLEEQVQSLKVAAAAAAAAGGGGGAAVAAAAAGSGRDSAELAAAQARVAELEGQLAVALEKSDSAIISGTDGIQKLQRELQEAQGTITALQAELSVAKSGAALSQQNSAAASEHSASSGVSPEVAAKLALYEGKIQQLMALVEEQGGQSDREAELEARLREAEERLAEYEAGGADAVDAAVRHRLVSTEEELAEAEHMATEALNLLEAAQADNAHLQDQLNQLRMDMDWQAKKATKDRADWEARMQDGFRRVEESVVLAERLQRDKDELQGRFDVLLADRNALEARLDPHAVNEQVAAEVERAKLAAEAQARIEVEALQGRVREMEEFVEKADASRLEMAARVAELGAQLAAVRREEQDSFDQVKTAEERADGLQLEVQYLQHEKERLLGELALAREAAEREPGGGGAGPCPGCLAAARAREEQASQLEQLQRDMAAAMLAAKTHSGAAVSLGQHKDALQSQLAETQATHRAELAAMNQQLEEAHHLADYSSRELAGVVQQLAAAEAERSDLSAKVAELHEDLSRLRTGDDGELRVRIEKLEKELLITRNARDVNALFKTEHDRIATELIETKLLWAEAQEQIVKLKQSLVKSQEKNISFASKLTRLETKFYKRLKEKKEDKEKKKRDKAAAAAAPNASSNESSS